MTPEVKQFECLGHFFTSVFSLSLFFFPQEINWAALFARKLKPPLVPILKSATDVSNFDKEFTSQKPVLTPPDDAPPLSVKEQARFKDFDFLSKHLLDV